MWGDGANRSLYTVHCRMSTSINTFLQGRRMRSDNDFIGVILKLVSHPRYFCRQYAESSTPDQGTDANICPAGYFCPEGTTEPDPCPPGTYSDLTQLESQDQCYNCTKGSVGQISCFYHQLHNFPNYMTVKCHSEQVCLIGWHSMRFMIKTLGSLQMPFLKGYI